MIATVFLFMMIYQRNDTLFFERDGVIADRIILAAYAPESISSHTVRMVKIASRGDVCILFTERTSDHVAEAISLIDIYDDTRELLWHDSAGSDRKFSITLSLLHDSLYVITETALDGKAPLLYTVRHGRKEVVIPADTWTAISSFAISPSGRYLIAHTRHPYSRKMWDFIHFVDLQTKEEWQYLFPICLSCKRAKIKVTIDDDGQSEIIYKTEHRVFSREGRLIDVYMKQ